VTTSADVVVRTLAHLRDVGRDAWDALVEPEDSPFVLHGWLATLEEAECVTPEEGWLPRHITLWRGGVLVAAAPAYVKGSTEGEFVFDHPWQRAAHRLRIPYFPKLIVAVPFTPATGGRLLVRRGEPREVYAPLLARAVREAAAEMGVSGVHVLFPSERDVAVLERSGYETRLGIQYQWANHGYATYGDFLATLKSKKRRQLQRERRVVQEGGIEVTTLRGPELCDEALAAMYRFYGATVEKYYPWTRRYLTERFFWLARERLPESLEIVLARKGGRPIAGALCVAGETRLYGRYWGCDEPAPPFLHFHVCYYYGIEECIRRGLAAFEPGAGGEHKLARGFDPTLTHSSHWLFEPRLARLMREHLASERAAIAAALQEYREGRS
jgi:predicted N-acyltransferase